MGGVLGRPTSARGLPKTQAALAYARELHAGQSREADGAPFILHPREVASLLYRDGATDHLIAAGALHDVLEKTPAAVSELRERFGGRIARLVLAVSEDERIVGYEERKTALRERAAAAGEEALRLFAADKVSKVRELRRLERKNGAELRGGPALGRGNGNRRLVHYRECLTLLRERLPDSRLVRQLEAELGKLSRETHVQRARAQPSATGMRPAAIASSRAWWSRSLWSAYSSANSAIARSKVSAPPR
jgi:hypothetical protein